MAKLRSVKGMNDIVPAASEAVNDVRRWHRLEGAFRNLATRYGFGEIRTPLLEPTELFVRSIGEASDIVEKEMYTFDDKGGKTLTLRPEGTASCARAFLQHNVGARQAVTKWFYVGPMYRRERPAKGRYRQFHQLGCEVYGDAGPFVDAELISLVVQFLADIGIAKTEVLINSLGRADTRDRFRTALLDFLRPQAEKLSEDSQRRLERNPLRVLDSKAPQDQEIAADAPRLTDFLDGEDAAHFASLQESLTALSIPFVVSPQLVRGLDYYNRTLFEVRATDADLGSQNTLCGGGRYDTMLEQFGGANTPAIGFAMGMERLLLSMPSEKPSASIDAFVVVQDPALRADALRIANQLRGAGCRVDSDLRGTSLKSQLRRADKSGARFAVIIGQREVDGATAQLKDLQAGGQREVAQAELAQLLTAG